MSSFYLSQQLHLPDVFISPLLGTKSDHSLKRTIVFSLQKHIGVAHSGITVKHTELLNLWLIVYVKSILSFRSFRHLDNCFEYRRGQSQAITAFDVLMTSPKLNYWTCTQSQLCRINRAPKLCICQSLASRSRMFWIDFMYEMTKIKGLILTFISETLDY